jgi:hypothetical protein
VDCRIWNVLFVGLMNGSQPRAKGSGDDAFAVPV